jgi:hypothetical protein
MMSGHLAHNTGQTTECLISEVTQLLKQLGPINSNYEVHAVHILLLTNSSDSTIVVDFEKLSLLRNSGL